MIMENPNIKIESKTQRYKAGDVVAMEYTGKNKPCKKAMAVLLTPFTVKDGTHIGKFSTMYAIDTDKEKFLPSGLIGKGDVQCKIARVTSARLKTWFFGKILEQCQTPAPKQNVWVVFDESLNGYSLAGRRIRVYKNEDEARKAFDETVEVTRRTRSAEGWEIDDDDEDFFEAYPDGSWGTSHETVELKKCKIGEGVWLHE